jgi:rhodanese-related sulfurtransferase
VKTGKDHDLPAKFENHVESWAMEQLPLEISCHDVSRWMETDHQPLLLDCREADEFALVAIAGAKLLPMSEIQSRAGELSDYKEGPIVVYCHLGMRSAQVTQWLREQGFNQVQSMAGGIDQWAVEVDPSMKRY